MIIAGVDVGNSTTEVCIGKLNKNGTLDFLSEGSIDTTGTKGTSKNVKGIKQALVLALNSINKDFDYLDLIRINEAAPVIGDTAMETITETIISDSTMIGHNPDTPAGEGIAIGYTIPIENLNAVKKQEPLIVIVNKNYDYEKIANILNATGINIAGVILQKDEAVLVYNRLNKKIPIIDEVKRIEEIPSGKFAAIEVAGKGQSVKTLSNPYGIAKYFDLNSDETRQVIPVAKSLIGKKSAVVIKTIRGGVKEKTLKAGTLTIKGNKEHQASIDIDNGADAIMNKVNEFQEVKDVKGEKGTYIGDMLSRMKESLQSLSEEVETLNIKDILAIDTFVPVNVKGALAGEVAMEKAVAIAAMVKANKLPMNRLAELLEQQLKIPVKVAGVEAVMAAIGALTTKGSKLPLAILDLGGGSTDAAVLFEDGKVISTHLAGAGAFITMMINEELCLNNKNVAELIKRYPLAKVNSLYHMTMENGEVIFFKEPLNPKLYARVVIVKEDEYIPIMTNLTLEKIVSVRKDIKKKVFVTNAIRALKQVANNHNIKSIPNVALVGGSALDLEIPELIQQELSNYNIVAGRADVRSKMGPRNAVATGLVMSYISEVKL
ncbi:MAG: diol dehydratase reactivase subunit alpha [Eubacteriales bacterium]